MLNQIKTEFLDEISALTSELHTSQLIEGQKLSFTLLDKINQIEKIVANALFIMPNIRQNYQARLKQKLIDTFADILNNEQRFLARICVFLSKN